jgi:hypothetical protein
MKESALELNQPSPLGLLTLRASPESAGGAVPTEV